MFWDTSIRKIFFWIMKINNFRGGLTDISANKEALLSCRYMKDKWLASISERVTWQWTYARRRHSQTCALPVRTDLQYLTVSRSFRWMTGTCSTRSHTLIRCIASELVLTSEVFFKIKLFFLAYFDPISWSFDNRNEWFSGWPKQYFGYRQPHCSWHVLLITYNYQG